MGASEPGNEGADPETPQRPWHVEIDSVAKIELATAILNYELKSDGLGERFRVDVESMIVQIAGNPFLYQRVTRIHRRAVMHVFPYTIYFAVHKKSRRILVLNIHHAKRHPKYWRRNKPRWRQ